MKGAIVLILLVVVQTVMSGRPPIRTTTAKPVPPVDCDVKISDDDDQAILLPNPKDCGSYYMCVGSEPVLMKCPDGLEFSPELEVCDWPQSANCTIVES